MWRVFLTGFLFLATVAYAQAPASRSVSDYYRDYRAAFDRGDMAAAETPASAALAASLARDGEGGRTGVLAMNLALVRLWLGRPADAYDPAALAFRIVQAQGAAAGIDPLLAQLTLGRAELATAPTRGVERLASALAGAAMRPDLDEQAYAGAVALGSWAIEAGHLDTAQTAWAQAVVHSNGASINHEVARAIALTNEAASILLGSIRRHALRPTTTAPWLAEAYALLTEAGNLIRHEAVQSSPNNDITPVQIAYAETLAWRSLANTLGRPFNQPDPPDRDRGLSLDHSPEDAADTSTCPLRMRVREHGVSNFSHYYPQSAVINGGQGVVVLRLILDDTAHASRVDVLATAPGQTFSAAAVSVQNEIELTRAPDAPAGCTMPHVIFTPINFRLRR